MSVRRLERGTMDAVGAASVCLLAPARVQSLCHTKVLMEASADCRVVVRDSGGGSSDGGSGDIKK